MSTDTFLSEKNFFLDSSMMPKPSITPLSLFVKPYDLDVASSLDVNDGSHPHGSFCSSFSSSSSCLSPQLSETESLLAPSICTDDDDDDDTINRSPSNSSSNHGFHYIDDETVSSCLDDMDFISYDPLTIHSKNIKQQDTTRILPKPENLSVSTMNTMNQLSSSYIFPSTSSLHSWHGCIYQPDRSSSNDDIHKLLRQNSYPDCRISLKDKIGNNNKLISVSHNNDSTSVLPLQDKEFICHDYLLNKKPKLSVTSSIQLCYQNPIKHSLVITKPLTLNLLLHHQTEQPSSPSLFCASKDEIIHNDQNTKKIHRHSKKKKNDEHSKKIQNDQHSKKKQNDQHSKKIQNDQHSKNMRKLHKQQYSPKQQRQPLYTLKQQSPLGTLYMPFLKRYHKRNWGIQLLKKDHNKTLTQLNRLSETHCLNEKTQEIKDVSATQVESEILSIKETNLHKLTSSNLVCNAHSIITLEQIDSNQHLKSLNCTKTLFQQSISLLPVLEKKSCHKKRVVKKEKCIPSKKLHSKNHDGPTKISKKTIKANKHQNVLATPCLLTSFIPIHPDFNSKNSKDPSTYFIETKQQNTLLNSSIETLLELNDLEKNNKNIFNQDADKQSSLCSNQTNLLLPPVDSSQSTQRRNDSPSFLLATKKKVSKECKDDLYNNNNASEEKQNQNSDCMPSSLPQTKNNTSCIFLHPKISSTLQSNCKILNLKPSSGIPIWAASHTISLSKDVIFSLQQRCSKHMTP